MCGENLPGSTPANFRVGSSPRVRGKLARINARKLQSGLIPACAGKTRRSGLLSVLLRAHPRVCGENHANNDNRYTTWGSSPRVRGKPISTGLSVAG